jgi:serine protease Do
LIDEYYDLALLRIDATGLPAPKLGNSDLVLRGDPIVVMGAPAGLERTMTYGFITNIRDFRISGPRGYDGMLVLDGFVVDAATHTGMETGPIFNSYGELVAVVSRKGVGRGGAIENISYCIPVNLLTHVANQMIDVGKVCHPWLGIFPYIYYTRSLALYMGIPINEIDPETAEAYDVVGILVEMVADTSPAAEAGIVRGDLILRADEILLRTVKDLEEIILNKQCDETITLTIIRNFDIKLIDITIGNKQEDYGNIYFAYGRVSI